MKLYTECLSDEIVILKCLFESNYWNYFCIFILLILIVSNLSCVFPMRNFHYLFIVKITTLLS